MKYARIARVITVTMCAMGLPFLLHAAQEDAAEATTDSQNEQRLEKLVGSYQIIEGQKDGEAISAERLKDSTVAITRDTIAVVDPERKELYSARYKLGPVNDEGVAQVNMQSQTPKKGENAVGLMKLDGDQVWLIYSVNEQRPKDFEKTIEGQHLFKMKRKVEKQGGTVQADR